VLARDRIIGPGCKIPKIVNGMSQTQSTAATPAAATRPAPQPIRTFPRLRGLAWYGSTLLASQTYTLLSADVSDSAPQWRIVASYRPAWWRNLTASMRLSYRFFNDGFQALAALPTGHLVASVPGAIISVAPGESEFHITQEIRSGSPPRSIVATREGKIFWCAHQETSGGRQCCLYASPDRGWTWDMAHTFPNSIIGIRGLVHDDWDNCLWILADEESPNCRVFRASLDCRIVETAISGSEARMGTCLPTREAIYFGSHTPAGSNHIFRLRRNGSLIKVANVDGPCVSACQVGPSIFFSTTPRPNNGGNSKAVQIYRSPDGDNWEEFLRWRKDLWPGALQSGCGFFPQGQNSADLLAVSTVGVSGLDLQTTLWRI